MKSILGGFKNTAYGSMTTLTGSAPVPSVLWNSHGTTVPRDLAVSTPFDRFLLMVTVAVTPFFDALPTIGGFSAAWFFFFALGLCIATYRPKSLLRTAEQSLFVAAYLFLLTGFLVELTHSNSQFEYLFRFAQTIVGAVLMAVLCRDKRGLKAGLYGFLLSAVLMAVVLFGVSYGRLTSAEATTFEQGSRVRQEVFEGQDLLKDLNRVSFICAQGTVVALALGLKSSRLIKKTMFFCLASFCLVATSLPMSRSGILIVGLSSVVILMSLGKRAATSLLGPLLVIGIFLAIVPESFYSRFNSPSGQPEKDARVHVFTATIQSMPESIPMGVGAGNYWSTWAVDHGLSRRQRPLGAHNTFFQLILFWGLPGLFAFVYMLVQAYRCVPSHCERNALALCLLGLSVSMALRLVFSHNFYVKDFGIILGLIGGVRLWIWPGRVVR